MKLKTLLWLALALPVVWGLSSCSRDETPAVSPTSAPIVETPATATEAAPTAGTANVESVQIMELETFPVQINVRARGELPNDCTNIDEITTERNGSTFAVTITTLREAGGECTATAVPFEEVILLDVLGLEAGTYTVTVNGISGTFTLEVDNTAEAAAQLTPEPTEAPTVTAVSATISGLVWHDLCAVAGDEDQEDVEPAEGCVAAGDEGAVQANGVLDEEEPGIAGVEVSLGAGECPGSEEVATAVTNEEGSYTFPDLDNDTYCVYIDPLSETNSDILLPGSWTAPETGTNETTVTISEGESVGDVNFGWDYQFLPIPEVDLATCTNSIEFVEDLSIPDDTVFPPGQEFEKGWRLRNNGTCPWTTDYSLTFVGGDEIPGPISVTLPSPVAPGQTVDLSVTFTAPEESGTYRSNWQISDAAGEPFGINGFIGDAFWLQIVVEEGAEAAETPLPNSASISGLVWADFCTLLEDGSPSVGCVEIGENSGFYRADGTFNNNEGPLAGIVVSLGLNACPEDGVVGAANVLETATTGDDGIYTFTNLDAGTYCVFVDALSEDNVDLLIPGDWTYPAPGTGRIGIVLDPGEERENVDFGWDYEE